ISGSGAFGSSFGGSAGLVSAVCGSGSGGGGVLDFCLPPHAAAAIKITKSERRIAGLYHASDDLSRARARSACAAARLSATGRTRNARDLHGTRTARASYVPGVPRKLPIGAELTEGGVHFRVWAPAWQRVTLVLESPVRREIALRAEGNGYHAVLVDDLGAGAQYRFRLGDTARLHAD